MHKQNLSFAPFVINMCFVSLQANTKMFVDEELYI